jgi:iron uptake system component EfeO
MVVRSRRRRAAISVTAVAVLALVSAGCSSDDDGGETGSDGTVEVTLQEFAVLPSPDSAPAGEVTFNVTNTGPEDVHEFVVFATDLAPDALPTAPDGSVDETGEGVELINEIEDIAVGDTPTLTVTLDAGSYVFICNIVEEEGADTIVHYQQGMRVGFTAE